MNTINTITEKQDVMKQDQIEKQARFPYQFFVVTFVWSWLVWLPLVPCKNLSRERMRKKSRFSSSSFGIQSDF